MYSNLGGFARPGPFGPSLMGFPQRPPRYLGGFDQPSPFAQPGAKPYVPPEIPGGYPGPQVSPQPAPGYLGGYATPGAMPGAQVGVGRAGSLNLGGFGRPGPLPGIAAGEPPPYDKSRLLGPPATSLTGQPPLSGSAPGERPPLTTRGSQDQYGNYNPQYPVSPDAKGAAGTYIGPYARMPGTQTLSTPYGRRPRGAAEVWAALGKQSWEEAERQKKWARESAAAAYASGTMSEMDKMIYEQALAMEAQGQWDDANQGKIAWQSDRPQTPMQAWMDANQRPPEPGSMTNAWQSPELSDWYSYRLGWPAPPQASWGLGETPTTEQLSAAEKAYYDWLRQVFGEAPEATPESEY